MILGGVLLFVLSNGVDVHILIMGVALIFMSPGIVRTELDFCARTFSENIYMFIVLLWLIFIKTGIVIYLIPIVFLTVILLYTHKFETQVFLFLGLIFTVTCGNISFLLGYCMILLFLVLLSSKYRMIFGGHCRFLVSCLKKLNVSQKNSIGKVILNSTKLVISNPAIVFTIYFFCCTYNLYKNDIVTLYCFWGAVGLFFIGMLIKNIKMLFFIGSGDRYIDYSVIFTTCFIISVSSNINTELLNYMLLLYLIIDMAIMIKFYNKEQSKGITEIMKIGRILKFRKENNIFFDSASQLYNLLSYESGKAVFGALSSYGVDEMFDIINNKIPLDEVIDKYDIEILISGADNSFQNRSTHKFLCIYTGENWKAYVIAD